jgi:hypothetical protein
MDTVTVYAALCSFPCNNAIPPYFTPTQKGEPVTQRVGMEDFVRFDNEAKALKLSAPIDVASGEEMFISYGILPDPSPTFRRASLPHL